MKLAKAEAEKEHEELPFLEGDPVCHDLKVKPFFGFRMYRYGLSKEGCFDIFVAETVPNIQTSSIIVQLRSEFIWLHGIKDAFYESLLYLQTLLDRYGIPISNITENRIDFAYHTNYIQDMVSFFSDEKLCQMQVSSFKRWGKEGCFLGDAIHNDYISLGRRKSNSVFVRIYNKSKEVVEMGYKQFFVPIWQEQGLISAFDRYLFDCIFEEGKQSWNYKEVARCRFYLEYGEDEAIRRQIARLLERPDASTLEYKALADACVPDLTNITNIEMQTKRKFYYDFAFPPVEYPKWVALHERRMYTVLQMLQSVRDFLTYDTIRFVDYRGKAADLRRERRPTARWWQRLSACGELDGISYELCKEYQQKYDVQRCKQRSLTNIATFASLLELFTDQEGKSFSLDGDVEDILCYLNDNDMRKYVGIRQRKREQLRAKFE